MSREPKKTRKPRKQKYQIRLSDEECKTLKEFVTQGKKSAREITRARVLLLANEGKRDQEITKFLGIHLQTAKNIRRKFCKDNHKSILEALKEGPRPGQPIKIDDRVDAGITMIACSDPPVGRARWTLRMISDKVVKLDFIDSISHESIRARLKKNN